MTYPVIIVGAGPVGLITAMDLAKRGVATVVLEQRTDAAPAHPRCNTTSARTMEILRRLGCSESYRACGLAADYPNDVAYSTSITGHEITRYHLPAANATALDERVAHDGNWASAERPHRASQFYLERVLRDHASTFDQIDLRFWKEVTGVEQGHDEVQILVKDVGSGVEERLTARFLLACDGGRSTVRKQVGISFEGEAVGLGRTQSVVIRSKDVLQIMQAHNGLAWMNWLISSNGSGNLIAIDGQELWLTHLGLPPEEEEVTPETIDRQIQISMGCEIEYEVVHTEVWQLNRLVAETYRSGNVFLAGDAAHIWPPFAGHGMNTGIEDGIGVSWMLAAVIDGWAPASILSAYARERHNVGEMVSRAAAGLVMAQREIYKSESNLELLSETSAEGEAARKSMRDQLVMRDSIQFNPQGMNFGLHYDESTLIAYDDGVAPEYDIRQYTPSTVPGCRSPYFAFIEDGMPIYDRFGLGFTLLRSDTSIDVSEFTRVAASVGMPFEVIDIEFEPKARLVYDKALVLVRPDDRVAWRGDCIPEDPQHIIDLVRGVFDPT